MMSRFRMTRALAFSLLRCWLLFVTIDPTWAQGPTVEVPVVGRPTGYSNLVGRFTLAATVEPREVIVEEPVTLRVTLAGQSVGPVLRQNLRLFSEEFERAFFVEPVPELDRTPPGNKTWEFAWRLRPKTVAVREVPALKLAYFAPAIRRFQTATSEPIDLTVLPRPEPAEIGSGRELPAEFASLEPFPEHMVRHDETWIEEWGPTRAILLALVIAACSYRLAARSAPDAGWSPGEAAEAALAELAQPAPPCAQILTNYLAARFALRAVDPTPAEVGRVLRSRGMSRAVQERWVAWWQDVDRARFAPPSVGRMPEGSAAAELIRLAEAEPCSFRPR